MLLFLLITKIQTNNGLKFLREIEVITLGIKKRFKSSVLNVSDDVFKTKLSEFLAENAGKLEVLSGAASKQLVIAGKAVTTSSSKVSTILGRFTPDIEDLFNELGSFKNVGLGEVKGGINILNKPDYYTKLADWWEAFNEPWLNEAVARGDDIWSASNPLELNLLFKDLDGIPIDKLKTSDALARYLKGLEDQSILGKLTGFGKETQVLSKNGYIFNIDSKMFLK